MFEDQRIILTGASSGIGRALAVRLAAEHAVLALVGRDPTSLAAVVEECRAAGAKSVGAHVVDLAAVETIEGHVRDIVAGWGQVPYMVIHSAGVGLVGRVEETPVAAMQNCLSVHTLAALALARSVLADMRRRGSGRLVLISSGTAWYGVPGEAVYSAAKAALERIAEALAIELEGSGVTVTVVSPGPVETPLMRSPQVFGRLALMARPAVARGASSVADAIVKRLQTTTAGRIEISLRPRLVRYLSGWTPSLLAAILARKFHAARSES
jgi:short-subunit dehydrogenase